MPNSDSSSHDVIKLFFAIARYFNPPPPSSTEEQKPQNLLQIVRWRAGCGGDGRVT